MNSRRKGKNGELELKNKLRAYGFDCRRGQQYCGTSGDADVVGLPGIHIECKRVEALNIEAAMQQSRRDCEGTGELPTVMFRKNGEKWKVCMDLEDWVDMYKPWERGI